MVNALQRNSFGLSLAVHGLLLVALSWVGMPRPIPGELTTPIEITFVEEFTKPLPPPRAVQTPADQRVAQTRPQRPQMATARRVQTQKPRTLLPPPRDAEANIAQARAARRQAEAERLGRIQTSLGKEPPAGVALPGTVSGELSGRRLLSRVQPHYPESARQDGAEGDVVLRVHVAPNGTVTAVSPQLQSGDARLDQAAIAAVGRWRFSPLPPEAPQDVQAGTVPVRFRLR